MKERDKKEEKEEKKKVKRNSIKINEDINIDTRIFVILCFHNDLWNEELVFFNPKIVVAKIEFVHSYELNIKNNYIPKIYCIYFHKDQKRPKTLNLSISLNSLEYWELNELSIKEKTKFIFGDIKIVEKNLYEFIYYINNDLNKKEIKRNNYCYDLDFEKKLEIYKTFIDKICIQNPEKLNEYNENLAYDFITIFKKNKLNKLYFSNAINLFCLSCKNNNINSFLDISPIVIYLKNNFKNDFFLTLLNEYNNNKNEFMKSIIKNKSKDKNEKYEKLLDDFMLTYFLFYEKDKFTQDKKMLLSSENILMKIINERHDITETTKILNDYLELLYLLYLEKEKKNVNIIRIIIKNKKNFDSVNFNEFVEHYNKVVTFQINKKKYFLDFSNMINKFIDNKTTSLTYLKKIYFVFKYELNHKDNYKLRDKLNKSIDKEGIRLYNNGTLKNDNLLDFISYNEIYLSNQKGKINNNDSFFKKYNEDYKKREKNKHFRRNKY